MHKLKPVIEKKLRNSKGFWDINESPNSSQMHRLSWWTKKEKKKKRTWRLVNLAIRSDNRVKIKESENIYKYLYMGRELKELWNMNGRWTQLNLAQFKRFWNTRKNGWKNRKLEDHPNYSIVEIGQNTEKNPWHLRRLAVPQTPVKDHLLRLVWKADKEYQRIQTPGITRKINLYRYMDNIKLFVKNWKK